MIPEESLIMRAIENLAPKAECSFSATDLDTLIWYSDDIEQPTNLAILAELVNVKAAVEKAEADKLAAKQSAQAKLAALGLTADEITAISNA
jgi:hypothetical protein